MSDILERLQNMFFRFGTESPDDAANRRIQTAKDAATEIEKLRVALKQAERERNHQHGRADRNAAQYAAEQAKREQSQAENEKLRAERDALREALRMAKDLYLHGSTTSAFIEICAALGEKE